MKNNNNAILFIRLNPELKRNFQKYCIDMRKKMSEMIREMIEATLEIAEFDEEWRKEAEAEKSA